MDTLTEEQKQRIEENRKKALERRAAAAKAKESLVNNSTEKTCSANSLPSTSSNYSLQKNPPNGLSPIVLSTGNEQISKISSPQETFNTNHISLNSQNGQNVYNASTFYSQYSNTANQKQLFPASNSQSTSTNQNLKNFTFNKPEKQVKGTFLLFDRNRFVVNVPYHAKMIELFKTIPSRMYNAKTKRWSFEIKDHDMLVEKLNTSVPDVLFCPLTKRVIKLFSKTASSNKEIVQHDLTCLCSVLHNTLFPFQKDGINFGIQLGGKVLIADDMGLGKTIQAIGIAEYYKNDWPLLVVMPSSVRYSWAEAFKTWLPYIESEMTIINTGKDHIPKDKVTLISYDLLSKRKDDIQRRNYKSVIFDESHFLKNPKSARTKAAQHVMKGMKRIIMLSGTPALSRPVELFPQISALNSTLFGNFMDFGIRYCNGKMMPWGWDFSGSSNMEELQILLEETVMIRRLKSEVIKQLPPKIRQMILLDTVQVASKNKVLKAMSKKMATVSIKGMERRGILLQYFHETGTTKLAAVCEYIKELLEADRKFLCFAHHQIVMNGICTMIEDANIDYIRIDGSTSSEGRKLLCDKFQLQDKCKVAVLSITAANTGITLTAAHLVVFAELFWNPGVLTQAEDRAHRIGQEDSVVVQYLVAKGTADDEIWPLVQRKLDTLNKAGLSKDNFKDSTTVDATNSAQPSIADMWDQIDFEIDDIAEDIPSKRLKLVNSDS